MKRFLILIVSLFCANLPIAGQGNGIEQPSDVVTVGGNTFLRWYGRAGRTYFIQVSDPNNHLTKWTWAPIIESGNNGYISYQVDGTADKGFFRLKYTDKPTTDPDYDDFDGDTISNLEEIIDYGSDPLKADTDGDGMPDNYEVTYYFDPNNNDGGSDYDQDGLTNLQEYNLATDPTYRDTDSDGMDDGFEVTYLLNPLIAGDATSDTDGDGLNNLWEYKFKLNPRQTDSNNNGVSDALEDHDHDRLTNISELVTHQTLPDQPDTDGDGLSDGWEILYGYSALVNNQTDANPNNNSEADPDNDGLINRTEDQLGTNPNNADTDGDGFSDFAENQAGSNATGAGSTPNNPGGTPGGPATTPPPIIDVKVKFGDHSGSHSEKYEVQLEPLEGDENHQKRSFKNSNYGQTQTETFHLPAGAKYKITLTHIGTAPDYNGDPKPDYDYTLEFTSNSTDTAIKAIPQDTAGILGVHDESEQFFASGKDATLYIAWLTSETVSETPTDRKRAKLGVGEEVNLKVKPSKEDASWTASVGKLSRDTGAAVLLTLKDDVGAANMKAVYLGETLTKDFTLFAPTGIDSAVIKSTTSYPNGKASAGMHLYPVVVAPTDVSFYNVQMLEVGEDASNVSGYFLDYQKLSHKGNGADVWFNLDKKNQWPESWDYATLTDWPAPWTKSGSFTWNIPARWKVVNSVVTSPEHSITGWNQVFSIAVGGAITIQKFDHSVTRTTSNIITSN